MPRLCERHTITFFGPLAQPNYQMYSVVVTNKNIFTSHMARTSTQHNLQIYSLSIFICVCLVLSKTLIKLYSQKQLLLNSEMNITGTLPQAGNLKLFVPSLSTQSSTRPKQNIFNVVLMRPDKTE